MKTAVIVVHGVCPTPRYQIQDAFATQLGRWLNETRKASAPKWETSILWPKIAQSAAGPNDVHATALRLWQDGDNANDPKDDVFDIFEGYWSPIDKNQTTVRKVLAWMAGALFIPLNASVRLYASFGKTLFDLGAIFVVSLLAAAFFAAAGFAANSGYHVFAGAAICSTLKPSLPCVIPSLYSLLTNSSSAFKDFGWSSLRYLALMFLGAYALTQLAISLYHAISEWQRRKHESAALRKAPSDLFGPPQFWRIVFQVILLGVAAFGLYYWPWYHPFVLDPSHHLMFSTILFVSFLGLFRSALGVLNGFFVNFIGDVQIYTTHDENAAFYKMRKEIMATVQQVILQVLRATEGALITMPTRGVGLLKQTILPPLYDRVVVAGHSLGSTIAMDAILTLHELYAEGGLSESEWCRLRALVTFGTSLEKTKFFFDVKEPSVSVTPDHWRNNVYGRLFTKDVDILKKQARLPDSGIFWANYWYFHDIISNEITSYKGSSSDNVANAIRADSDTRETVICENTRLQGSFAKPFYHLWVHSDYLWDRNFWIARGGTKSKYGVLDILQPWCRLEPVQSRRRTLVTHRRERRTGSKRFN